jgi:hypothetical protein
LGETRWKTRWFNKNSSLSVNEFSNGSFGESSVENNYFVVVEK